MPFDIMPLPFKPPRLTGLSEGLLASHYENNYGGAVRRLSAIDAELACLDWSAAASFTINGLKREQLIAHNSAVLHEVYFDSLGGADGLGGSADTPNTRMADALARDFGTVDDWALEFTAMGKAMGGGSGWVVLAWSRRAQGLINFWAADHAHLPADAVPIVALDMYEHAYHMDFGSNAGAYVDAFMANIHWGRPTARLDAACQDPAAPDTDPLSVSPEKLHEMLNSGSDIVLLDICLPEDRPKRHDKIAEAAMHLPADIDSWIGDLPTDRPIVAYCMYGFQVSGDAVTAMRSRGLDARVLAGGIAGWHAIGAPTVAL